MLMRADLNGAMNTVEDIHDSAGHRVKTGPAQGELGNGAQTGLS